MVGNRQSGGHMDLNRLTQKSQEALQEAQAIATERGHQSIANIHLLAALLQQDGGLIPRVLAKMSIDQSRLKDLVNRGLSKIPRVSGSGVEPGKIAVSQECSQLLVRAQEQAKRLKDEY